jgi:hypothetical protein
VRSIARPSSEGFTCEMAVEGGPRRCPSPGLNHRGVERRAAKTRILADKLLYVSPKAKSDRPREPVPRQDPRRLWCLAGRDVHRGENGDVEVSALRPVVVVTDVRGGYPRGPQAVEVPDRSSRQRQPSVTPGAGTGLLLGSPAGGSKRPREFADDIVLDIEIRVASARRLGCRGGPCPPGHRNRGWRSGWGVRGSARPRHLTGARGRFSRGIRRAAPRFVAATGRDRARR